MTTHPRPSPAGAPADDDAAPSADAPLGPAKPGSIGPPPPSAPAPPRAAPGKPGRPAATAIEDLAQPEYYFGRDMSWLEFNARVLAEAFNDRVPLLERVKFLTICASNLDEFFMKRVGLMKSRMAMGYDWTSHDGLTARQQLDAVRLRIDELQTLQADCYHDELRPRLAEAGIHIISYQDLTPAEAGRIDEWYGQNVFPVLTPLAVDPGHRFPFISNLSESLGILARYPGNRERLFARLKIPDKIPRLVSVPADGPVGAVTDPGDARLVPLDQIIIANLDDVFPGMEIADIMPFRVTRGAGVEQEGEGGDDLLEQVEAELRHRRFAEPVRLETSPEPSAAILDLLVDELGLELADVYSRRGPLEYADLTELLSLDRPELKDRTWVPVVQTRLRDEEKDIFSIIRERDVFVHHPYDSFNASVERFIAAAAADPHVLAIKQTIYRTSRDSPFVDSLIRAAEEGKQVACLVELRARFDEDKNVRFTRQLESHGVHVAYGVVGLKTHCKCSLVVRRESDGLRCYAHVGTGNYHPGTAQLYTDCGLLTCDPLITEDVINIFNYLTGRSLHRQYNKLLVAPPTMRSTFYDLIDREIEVAREGGPARIIAKMNQLEDLGIIRRLYRASQAGVKITVICRGFCCLRPGVPGLSENITILSVIGRFLEHARIFHFGAGAEDPVDGEWYIGSADWMSRNLSNRVEVITPVEDRAARARLARILEVGLADRRNAWMLHPDGEFTHLTPGADTDPESPEVLGTFETLCRDAVHSAQAEA